MICSAIQIDSFWKTFVLSNDCESSIRAIVIDPPRFGFAAPVLSGELPGEPRRGSGGSEGDRTSRRMRKLCV